MPKKIIKSVIPSPAQRINVGAGQIFNFPTRIKYIILACIGLVFYFNSLWNKYAYDDSITMEINSYVQMGFAGIPKILTNDSYGAFYKNGGGDPTQQLKGGRYRPLSEIIFAVEQGILGESGFTVFFRHLLNVLMYTTCLLAVFNFLDKFLLRKIPFGGDCAFLSTILFAIHPLHTEVVANIKSLDEILSLLFIMLTFIFSLKYLKEKKTKFLLFGMLFFFLSLLSKEYAITLVFFIPLLFYICGGKKPLEALISTLPYLGVFVIYFILRLNAIGLHVNLPDRNDIMMNPYLHATPMQKFATEWFIMGRYIKLLLYPYPLCFDYSYAYYQLVYRNLTDILVLLSIGIYVGAFIWGLWLTFKKNVLAFAVFFFLVNLLMVSNFFLYIGATMGERLAFHSSLGFVIILSYYFLKVLSKQKLVIKRSIVFGIVSVLTLVCLGETVQRNAEWCDNNTLFIHDVIVSPNSTWANNNTGWSYLGKSESKDNTAEQAARYVDSAYKYILKAIREDTTYSAAFGNMGGVYFHKGMYDSAKYYWDESVRLSHGSHIPVAQYKLLSNVFYEKGLELGKKGDPYGGIRELRKAASVADSNADIWYNLGGAYYSVKNYDSARYAWEKTLQLRPNDVNAKQGLQAIPQVNH